MARAMLPGLIDDCAAEHGVPVQTAIKANAEFLGFGGEQWTQLRDAYKAAKRQMRGPTASS